MAFEGALENELFSHCSGRDVGEMLDDADAECSKFESFERGTQSLNLARVEVG